MRSNSRLGGRRYQAIAHPCVFFDSGVGKRIEEASPDGAAFVARGVAEFFPKCTTPSNQCGDSVYVLHRCTHLQLPPLPLLLGLVLLLPLGLVLLLFLGLVWAGGARALSRAAL